MAFKDKFIVLTNSVIFQLIYLFSACALILFGALTATIWLCWIGGFLISAPLLWFFFDVFVHIINPKYEEPLLPPVMPPNFKRKDEQENEPK